MHAFIPPLLSCLDVRMRAIEQAVGLTALLACICILQLVLRTAPGPSATQMPNEHLPPHLVGHARRQAQPSKLNRAGRIPPASEFSMPSRNSTSTPAATVLPGLAGHASEPSDAFLILGVATAPKNTGHRLWIRRTWMTLPNVYAGVDKDSRGRPVQAFFLVGVLQSDGTAQPSPTASVLHEEQA